MQQLSLRDLVVDYGAAPVLDGVDLTLRAGEVHALMGENGAGKSTLIKVLAGLVRARAASVQRDGQEVVLSNPTEAAALGLRFVHQELNVVASLTVAENILLSRRTPRRFGIAVDWRALQARAAAALAQFGADHIDPRARAGTLSTGDRMLVVLAGLVASDDLTPSVFVMDEPTAALTHAEAERLFAVIARLKADGAAILYVSHRLGEVTEIADRVTVLRDGRVALHCPMAETSKDGIISAMTGQDVADVFPPRRAAPSEGVSLKVEDLAVGPVEGVTFTARPGEIVGIAGLEGAGQSDVLRAILGDTPPRRGAIVLADGDGTRSAAEGWSRGLAYVPRERRREGLMLGRGIAPNIVLPHLGRLSVAGMWSRTGAERAEARIRGEDVRLKYNRLDQSVATLSGGNQQKVVFARAVAGGPRLALLDEPTRGVDVGARADIYAMIRDLSEAGTSIILASSDLPELIGLSDRIVVLSGGAQAGIVAAEGLEPADLLAMVYGDRAVGAAA